MPFSRVLCYSYDHCIVGTSILNRSKKSTLLAALGLCVAFVAGSEVDSTQTAIGIVSSVL